MTITAADTTAPQAAALEHFAAKLRYETDPSAVVAAQAAGGGRVLTAIRGHAGWTRGGQVGAVHMPTAEIAERAAPEIPLDTPVVVYCWGPGCNGSTKAALQFSRLGYEVRELIGGVEEWAREGVGGGGDPRPHRWGVGQAAHPPEATPLR